MASPTHMNDTPLHKLQKLHRAGPTSQGSPCRVIATKQLLMSFMLTKYIQYKNNKIHTISHVRLVIAQFKTSNNNIAMTS